MSSSPDFGFELSLLPSDTRYLLGIDEVGRGPIAGPVTLGAFLIDLSLFDPQVFYKLKVRDSKLLSPDQRRTIFSAFQNSGYSFTTVSAPAADIDNYGINHVIAALVNRILQNFRGRFDYCLLDGNLPDCGSFCRSLTQADRLCYSVAAASICAKVTRDGLMEDYGRQYPGYGFPSHKGYGTPAHLAALRQLGPCPIHRLTFRPLK